MRFEEILKSLAETVERRNLENSVAQNFDKIIELDAPEKVVDQE